MTPEGFLFERTGGDLALDFANTVDGRPTPRARELLADFGDLVSCKWGSPAEGRRGGFRRRRGRIPAARKRPFGTRGRCEAISGSSLAVAGRRPTPASLETLNHSSASAGCGSPPRATDARGRSAARRPISAPLRPGARAEL
jgi:hypothetical protein